MPARWKAGPALLALSLAGQLSAAPLTPREMIARCGAQAGAMPTGIAALSKACPGVEDALAQLQLTGRLPPGWRKTLTGSGLADIGMLLQRYATSLPAQPPRAAALRSIAARLVPRPPPLTWLGRIEAWIRHSLLRPLAHWLRSLGPQLRHSRHPQAILFGLIALLLAASAAVLAYELRGSGLARRRRAAPPRRGRIAADPAPSSDGQSPELDWTQLREQPARLLRLLVDTLIRARRLERDRHLTCRELQREAQLETDIERASFAQVASLAERELYGPPGVNVLPEETLREARTLHARLSAAAAGGVRP